MQKKNIYIHIKEKSCEVSWTENYCYNELVILIPITRCDHIPGILEWVRDSVPPSPLSLSPGHRPALSPRTSLAEAPVQNQAKQNKKMKTRDLYNCINRIQLLFDASIGTETNMRIEHITGWNKPWSLQWNFIKLVSLAAYLDFLLSEVELVLQVSLRYLHIGDVSLVIVSQREGARHILLQELIER